MRHLAALTILAAMAGSVHAQAEVERRLADLERRLKQAEELARQADSRASASQREASDAAPFVVVAFLCGVLCALWAQNTGRSAWLWFFLGLFFNVIIVLLLLAKNADDLNQRRRPTESSAEQESLPKQ